MKKILLVISTVIITLTSTIAYAGNADNWTVKDTDVCAPINGDDFSCLAKVRHFINNGAEVFSPTQADLGNVIKRFNSFGGVNPQAAPGVNPISGAGLRTAYNITNLGDPTKVIAIVDAYDNPKAFSNLTTFRSQNSLPTMNSCALANINTSATPCFAKVNQSLGMTPPSANTGWAQEIDLDLQAASAVCPLCSILLVEASSATFANLGAAVTAAASVSGVRAISNSFGTSSDVAQTSYPQWNNVAASIPVFASTGDAGYQRSASFPASSTNVVGVGGTTLAVGNNGVRYSESAWSGGGSGCSAYNAKPTWQSIPSAPCGTKKAISDVSAVADPASGLQVYTTGSSGTTWYVFGGTSLASPIIAAMQAMQGGYDSTSLVTQYSGSATKKLLDITTGSNASSCTPSIMCKTGTGWDGPTGVGSIYSAITGTTPIGTAPAISSVTISGSAKVNYTLTASASTTGTAPITLTYQWQWSSTPTGSYSNITGARSSTYTISSTYRGRYIKVAVVASNSFGTTATTYSAPTTQIA